MNDGDFPRPTPYELVFQGGAVPFEAERFPAILSEAEARDVALERPGPLVMLGTVGALMREMLLEHDAEDDGGAAWQAVPAQAIEQMGALIFHALRFWRAGGQVLHLDVERLRALVAEPVAGGETAGETGATPGAPGAPGDWRFAAPHDAGYLQLPRNLVWARPDPAEPPEPVDGMFWAAGARLELLLALGVRPDRPGFTAVALGADIGADGAAGAGWADAAARPGGRDFENVLPGGELQELLAVTTEAEALKLVTRAFRLADREGLPGRRVVEAWEGEPGRAQP